MIKKTLYCIFISIFVFSLQNCNNSDKRKKLEVIKTKLNLTKQEYNSIKNDTSIVNHIIYSLKKNIPIKIINRRLDSFFLKKYTTKELITGLDLDRMHPTLFLSVKNKNIANHTGQESIKKYERYKSTQEDKLEYKERKKKPVYLFFNSNSNETYNYDYDGSKINSKKYRYNTESDMSINFYIKRELFKFQNKTKKTQEISKSDFNKIKFSSLDYLNDTWRKSNLFSKLKVFDKIYVVKPSKNEELFYLYEVSWIEYVN